MKKRERPNYRWWVSMEVWTLKQATLLLHGMDPNQYPSLKPYVKDLPPEYAPLQKTYLMLHQYPWEELMPDYYYQGKGIHPAAIVSLALQNKLPLSKRLRKLVIERFHRENQLKQQGVEIKQVFSPYASFIEPLKPKIIQHHFGFTARERKNLLRSLGILIRLLFADEQSSPRHWYAKRLNSYQTAQTILEKAQQMGISTKGLKSLDRKITEAMAILAAEQDE